MAATKSGKNPTRGNDTPNTPDVSESAIAAMKVGELRRKLQNRGVKGTAGLKKPELVKKLIKLETTGSKSTRSTGKRSVSGRKRSTSGNDTPNTPEVSESAIAAMKVGELRRKLQNRGVKGTADLKRPELVKKLIKLETTGSKSTRSTGKRSVSGRKRSTSGNDTPNTTEVSESAIAAMKVGELRRKLQNRGVKGTADLKKPELVKKLIKLETADTKSTQSTTTKSTSAATTRSAKKSASSATPSTTKKSASVATTKTLAPAATDRSTAKKLAAAGGKLPTTKKLVFAPTDLRSSDDIPTTLEVGESEGGGSRGRSGGGKRTGKATSNSMKYSQEIKSPKGRPERPGRSLTTTDHEVIRRWAAARKAVPATVAGTSRDGELGVLQFDFPGYSGDRLTEVSWSEWFNAFDKRRLTFIYREKQSSGKRNFFQLENLDEWSGDRPIE